MHLDLTQCMENKDIVHEKEEEKYNFITNIYIFDSCIVYIERIKHYIVIKWIQDKNIWQLYDDMDCRKGLKQISFQNAKECIEEGGYMFFYVKNNIHIGSSFSCHLPQWFIKNKTIKDFEIFKIKCNITTENEQKINIILEKNKQNNIMIYQKKNDLSLLICIGQYIPFLWLCFSLGNNENQIEYINTNLLLDQFLKCEFYCFLKK